MHRQTSPFLALVGAFVLAAAGSLSGCSNGDSTGPSGPATISGRLFRAADSSRSAARATADFSGAPIAGAEVIVDGAPSGTFTDAQGEFTLTLDPGTHTIAVNADGANSQSMTVVVDGTTSMTIEFELDDDGVLTAHEDVDDDGDIDGDDDIDDDGDVDDDDADGDIDDDGVDDIGDDSSDDDTDDDIDDDSSDDEL